jgi:hypothetical protein
MKCGMTIPLDETRGKERAVKRREHISFFSLMIKASLRVSFQGSLMLKLIGCEIAYIL